MKLLMFIFFSAGLFAQSKPMPSVPCRTVACQSFNELAREHDSTVVDADMACFYDGNNPANAETESNRTVDEFFLTMDGRKTVTKRGIHPGIFVSVVLNGQPEDYHGYGPTNGGLEDSNKIKAASLFDTGNAGTAYTYDDLGDAVRFAYFYFSTIDYDKKPVTLDEVLVRIYHETVIRKSTKRFTEKMMDYRGGFENKEYHGRCYAVKR